MSSEVKTSQTIGHRLNQYVLLSEIGRGGHGTVYRAYHEDRPTEEVAIKVIDNRGNLDTLLVEPEILSRLQHPNIVGLRDYFLHAGRLVLVMDYIDGIDLGSYLENHGRFTPLEIKILLSQIASALSHAHSQNTIHRDLKLSNILVTGIDGKKRYVLVDFGVSRMAEGIQMVRHVAGTLSFMAPEQLRGRPSEQSDLWASGVVAYVLLTGIMPFEGDTREDLSSKILYSTPQPPSVVLSEETDSDLERIIYHLLEKQPINRTLSADNLLAELEDWVVPMSQEYVPQPDKAVVPRSVVPSWEQRNRKTIKASWILLCIFLFLAIVPDAIVGSAIVIGGIVLFYIGQGQETNRSILYTIGGFGLMLVGVAASVITWGFLGFFLGLLGVHDPEVFDAYSSIQPWISLPFYIVSLHYLVKIRRLEREAFLLQILRTGSLNAEKLIDLLGDFVDVHLGDINVHQKYVETLLSSGRVKEAIVESKRIIDIDPYNFGANLMLAHGYFEVGLLEECLRVCNNYLAISGYSFEFSDLKVQCMKHLEGQGYGEV
jgi:serine/threonine-protein kinase